MLNNRLQTLFLTIILISAILAQTLTAQDSVNLGISQTLNSSQTSSTSQTSNSVQISNTAQTFTKNATMSVMGSKIPTEITFSTEKSTVTESDIAKTENDSIILKINEFSYKDKTVGEFKVNLKKDEKTGLFFAKNTTSESVSKEKSITINIIECSLNPENQKLKIKYKPGKMPFPILLETD